MAEIIAAQHKTVLRESIHTLREESSQKQEALDSESKIDSGCNSSESPNLLSQRQMNYKRKRNEKLRALLNRSTDSPSPNKSLHLKMLWSKWRSLTTMINGPRFQIDLLSN